MSLPLHREAAESVGISSAEMRACPQMLDPESL